MWVAGAAVQSFYYSSLSDEEYVRIFKGMGCCCVLLERDQYPADHVVLIGVKR